jgi:DNA-binding CsgD family transcriptional regulator
MRRFAHTEAMSTFAEALRACPSGNAEAASQIIEQMGRAARLAGQPRLGLELLTTVESEFADGPAAGHLHLAKARLLSYVDDYAGRNVTLLEAERAFARWDQTSGRVTALSELAFPAGRTMTLKDRIRYGRQGMAAADQLEDSFAWSYCAANLAASLFHSGDTDGIKLLRKARPRLNLSSGPERIEFARQSLNLSTYHLWLGEYQRAEEPLREASAIIDEPFWKVALGFVGGILAWRSGRWDAALPLLDAASSDSSVGFYRIAEVIGISIRFERGESVSMADAERALEDLLRKEEDFWATLALALCVQLRGWHRQPNPGRDVLEQVGTLRRLGMRQGSQDLLPVVASVDESLHQRVVTALQDALPPGRHAMLCSLLGDGIWLTKSGRQVEAVESFHTAADGFEEIGEPFWQARAMEEVSRASTSLTTARSAAHRAAELFTSMRAARSLSRLVRASRRRGLLTHHRLPEALLGKGSPGLTEREEEVAMLAGRGYSAREIAEQLVISPATVRKHLEHIKRKLGIARKTDLVRLVNG